MGPFLCNHTCWEFWSAQKTQHPSCSSLAVSCPPLSMVPEPCKGDTDVPLTAGYSTVTYSDHLWTSALTSTKHKFLWPKLTVALNYKHKRNIKKMVGQETASCPFSKTAVAYLLWPRSSPATDLWPGYSTRQRSGSYYREKVVGSLRHTRATVSPARTSCLEKSLNFALFSIPKCSESLDDTLSLEMAVGQGPQFISISSPKSS